MSSKMSTVYSLRISSVSEASKRESIQITKSVLLANHPFFAALLLDRMKLVLSEDLPTAATDGKYIIVNPDFFDKLTVKERVFVITHEILHAMFQHCPRAKQYQGQGFRGEKFMPEVWNAAGDFVINAMLSTNSIGKMPVEFPGLLDLNKYSGAMAVDTVYADIAANLPPSLKKMLQQGGQPQSGEGEGEGKSMLGQQLGGDVDGFDTHLEPDDYSEGEDVQWKQAIKAAAARAKAVGNLPGELEQFIDDFCEPQITWKDELRQTITRIIARDEATWSRPNRRRLVTPGIYMPGRTGYGAGEVWVWMDTSGSISRPEYMAYFGELEAILSECNPERLFLGFCDAQVNTVVELDQAEDLRDWCKKIPGGGGTSFRPPWEYMIKNGAQPSCVVYLTDMYGPFPDDSEWPTIWVATSDVEAPFGKTIRLNLEQ